MGGIVSAIKAVFRRNTTNATSVSGVRFPLVKVDGDPIGNASPADVQALLGVWKHVGTLSSSDNIDDKPIGSYIINVQNYGTPKGTFPSDLDLAGAFFMGFGAGLGSSWGLQILVPTGSTVLYFRTHVSSTFYSWRKI